MLQGGCRARVVLTVDQLVAHEVVRQAQEILIGHSWRLGASDHLAFPLAVDANPSIEIDAIRTLNYLNCPNCRSRARLPSGSEPRARAAPLLLEEERQLLEVDAQVDVLERHPRPGLDPDGGEVEDAP